MICHHMTPAEDCIHCLRERIQILERGEAPALAAAMRALEVERAESARLRTNLTDIRDCLRWWNGEKRWHLSCSVETAGRWFASLPERVV